MSADSNAWKVYIGGFAIIPKFAFESETQTLEAKIQVLHQNRVKVEAETKRRLIDKFNSRGDIKNVREFLSDDGEESLYRYFGLLNLEPNIPLNVAPIAFNLRLPLALQSIQMPSEAPTDSFEVIIDGIIMLILAECPLGERSSGIGNVRDQISTIIKETDGLDCVIIPPNVLPVRLAITTAQEKAEVTAVGKRAEVRIVVPPSTDPSVGWKYVYLMIKNGLYDFYEARNCVDRAENASAELAELEEEMLRKISQQSSTNWWRILRRHQNIRQLGEVLVKSLNQMADYSVKARWVTKSKKTLQSMMESGILLTEFDELMLTGKDYLDFEEFDKESFLRIYEEARRKVEGYFVAETSLVAAVFGGIIGSLLTLLIR